jgi:hypothetical protein
MWGTALLIMTPSWKQPRGSSTVEQKIVVQAFD